MAYTAHGHHIPGTLRGQGVVSAQTPIKCGGVDECPRCKQDVQEYMESVTGTGEDFQEKAKRIVKDYIDEKRTSVGLEPLVYELYVPWFSKTLQNWKAMVATTLEDEGWYFEVTYNGTRHETYLDFYRKFDNVRVPD